MPSKVPRTIAVSVFLLALGPTPAGAIDSGGGYFVRGIGNELCASYAVARESHRDSEYQEWLAGYESAFNRWTSGVWNIETGDNFANSLQWLDYYCSTHPSATFGTAAQDLIAFLYPAREREGASASLPQGGAGASAAPR
jgi:hypothetical protein